MTAWFQTSRKRSYLREYRDAQHALMELSNVELMI